jgi:hypothetical protein
LDSLSKRTVCSPAVRPGADSRAMTVSISFLYFHYQAHERHVINVGHMGYKRCESIKMTIDVSLNNLSRVI